MNNNNDKLSVSSTSTSGETGSTSSSSGSTSEQSSSDENDTTTEETKSTLAAEGIYVNEKDKSTVDRGVDETDKPSKPTSPHHKTFNAKNLQIKQMSNQKKLGPLDRKRQRNSSIRRSRRGRLRPTSVRRVRDARFQQQNGEKEKSSVGEDEKGDGNTEDKPKKWYRYLSWEPGAKDPRDVPLVNVSLSFFCFNHHIVW